MRPGFLKSQAMANKKVNRSAKDGRFVSEETAKNNPDTTVTETITDLRDELMRFCQFVVDNSKPLDSNTIDQYLKK